MLTPITAAVLAATPPTRAGLAASLVNTSRQIGSVLGIAVLGAVVEPQEASDLTHHLVTAHIPESLSATLAKAIATAGANAGAARLHVLEGLPFSSAALHRVIGLSFTDALHPAFVISALALLGVALLTAALLRRGDTMTQATAPDEAVSLVGAVRSPAPAGDANGHA